MGGLYPCELRLISAGRWGRRRDCRAAGSPVYCPYPGPARAFPGRRRKAGTERRWISPVCRRATRCSGRWWCLRASVPRCGTGCIGAQSLARGAAGGAVCAGGVAGAGGACAPAMPEAANAGIAITKVASSACSENEQQARRFRRGFRICGSGSVKNVPSAASGGARRG